MVASIHALHPVDTAVDVDVVIVRDRVSGLEVTTTEANCDARSVIIRVAGEVDASNAVLLASVVNNQAAKGRHWVDVDLSRVTFCDCAGLRALVDGHNAMLAGAGCLTLTSVPRLVERLLKITQLDQGLFLADVVGRA